VSEIFEGATKSFRIPNLGTGWTPQGLTVLDGRLLQAEYKDGRSTRLVSVDAKTGKVYGTVRIAATHAGGIAVVGDWLYVQDAPDTGVGHETVRIYRVADVRKGLRSCHVTGYKPYVKRTLNQQLEAWQYASFMTTNGSILMAGHHGVNENVRMYLYDVDQATGLLDAKAYFLVPPFTDGAAYFPGGFIFMSHGQDGYGTMTTTSQAGIVIREQRMPNLAEGAALVDGKVFISFESGARGGRPSAIDKLSNYYTIEA
jgi:hypothetical protein